MDAHDPKSNRADVGLDESRSFLTETVGKFVPQSVARRAVGVGLTAETTRCRQGDPVQFRVTFENRLPVPVAVRTPTARLWGWRVDGELEGSDERQYLTERPSQLQFRSGERKVVDVTWSGRFESDGVWTPAARGTHELVAFVATADERPRASLTVEIV
ncbi:hypothetical protein [Halomarina oriensis]|uniref:DUF7974 domain-containing protein n=1 Tax=Halomarina oriensis TaxID=671145 RepID=A0A6B0GPZ7_9EURY|nr:hypothetical protein [Halomarina oriensis]MWG36966.1 hypothetical protein [Halomarina oriensis]